MTGKGGKGVDNSRPNRDGPGAGDEEVTSTPLDAREERWLRRLELARAMPQNCSLVSFTLRMPAALRLSGDYDQRAGRWFDDLRALLVERGLPVTAYEFKVSADGPEGHCVGGGGSKEVKSAAVAFEESLPWGVLTDVDVMDAKGAVISRESLGYQPRPCLVCNRAAKICAPSREHSLEEVREAVERIANSDKKTASPSPKVDPESLDLPPALREKCGKIGLWARTAVLLEAAAMPKPGLVTPCSKGAHDDMDYFTFLRSAAALAPFWETFAALGTYFALRLPGAPKDLLPILRQTGLKAEGAMDAATEGVNTHKGLIFSLGILCAAAGMVTVEKPFLTAAECARKVASIVEGIVERDFAEVAKKAQSERTAGERLYLAEGVTGIRGEAEKGLPSVMEGALPRLKEALKEGATFNDGMTTALLALMERVEDTNVLARGGRKGEALVREASRRALALGGASTRKGRQAFKEMESLLESRKLSPGGAADLLAVTVFLHLLEEGQNSGEAPFASLRRQRQGPPVEV